MMSVKWPQFLDHHLPGVQFVPSGDTHLLHGPQYTDSIPTPYQRCYDGYFNVFNLI